MEEESTQFVLPPQTVAWCHLCDEGFASLEELHKHNVEKLERHRRKMGEDVNAGVRSE